MDNQKENLRAMVRGRDDLQKLRIQMGNRIVAEYKSRMGQAPSTKEADMSDADAKRILADIRAHYRRITDGLIKLPSVKKFKGDSLIDSYAMLCLVEQYVSIFDTETRMTTRLESIVEGFPIWGEFLEGVRGCGPAMAAVIISEFDIHKAKHPSSLWRYAGLDVDYQWRLESVEVLSGALADHSVIPDRKPLELADANDPRVTFSEDGVRLSVSFAGAGYKALGHYLLQGDGAGRSRRKEHLVERTYTDKNGEEKTRVGITFNPFLKTKLMGVLAGSFLKAGESHYRTVYDDYKHRLQSRPGYDEKKDKGHVHNAALRYMVKMFLIDLYAAWRPLEGLPVSKPYHEAKLGMAPHGTAA